MVPIVGGLSNGAFFVGENGVIQRNVLFGRLFPFFRHFSVVLLLKLTPLGCLASNVMS